MYPQKRPETSEHPTPALPATQAFSVAPGARAAAIGGFAAFTVAMHLDYLLGGLIILAITMIACVLSDRKVFSLEGGYDQKTIEDEELRLRENPWPLISAVATPLLATALPVGAGDLPVWATAVASGAAGAAVGWMTTRGVNVRARRMGRRLKRLMAESTLDGLTAKDVTVLAAHKGIVAALAGLGAVNGLRVRFWLLERSLPASDAEDIYRELSELSQAGMVNITSIDAGGDRSRHLVELTPPPPRARSTHCARGASWCPRG